MAQFIKANGEVTEVKPKNGKDFSLEEMQKFVGGYIEIVESQIKGDKRLIVLNEEGKLHGLPVNPKATAIFGYPGDFIVGDVLVCTNKEVK